MSVAAFACAWCLAFASPARAYRTASDLPSFAGQGTIAWPQDELRIRIVGALPPGVPSDEGADAVRASIATWQAVDCTTPRLALVDAGDVDIEIEWLPSWSAAGRETSALGTTDVTYEGTVESGFAIAHARIVLNAEHYVWTTRDGNDPTLRDIQAVVTHELGHALGLLHVCEPNGRDGVPRCSDDVSFSTSAMYPDYLGLSQRNLDADDVAGVCALYQGPPGCGMSCEQPAPTPDPAQTRVERLGQLGDPCSTNQECASRACSGAGYCTAVCDALNACPTDYACPAGFGQAQCLAERGVLGDRCDAPAQCTSDLCFVQGDEGMCTRSCTSDEDCPSDFECTETGTRSVCTKPSTAAPSSGCSVRRPPESAGSRAVLALCLFVLSSVVRRTRRNAKTP